MTGISLKGLPAGSKLILIGDWFMELGGDWKVACYFLDEKQEVFRSGLPVDLLPALVPGVVYPRTSVENITIGYPGTFKLPPMESWEKCRYADLPISLKRMGEFSEQIEGQIFYTFDLGHRVMWLPATELARMLFFHSSEVVRAAVYQGNTWQLATSEKDGWVGEVTFSSNVPVSYLNSLQFRKFFSWLLFNDDVENSFCSIFKHLNQGCMFMEDHTRWTFDFQPPDLSLCELSWAGYTGRESLGEKHHCYIREIRSIAGLSAPQLESVIFSHPDDVHYLENERNDLDDEKIKHRKPNVEPSVIDPDNPPKAGKRRYMIRLTTSGLHFDTEIDMRRSPRQVKALPAGEGPDMNETEVDDTVGITEQSDHGTAPRADINNLEEPELVDALEKMSFFKKMLEEIKEEYDLEMEIHEGEVPQNNCRTAHKIGDRARLYCHVKVRRDSDSIVHLLEIELKPNETLSTLLFRSDSDKEVGEILDALMSVESEHKIKAMHWKRKRNAELTIARHYLEHPDRKIMDEEGALASWVARAADRITRM